MTWQHGFTFWLVGAVVLIVYNTLRRGPRTWRDLRREGYPPLHTSVLFVLCLLFGAVVAFLIWPIEIVAMIYLAMRRRGE